MRRAIVLFLDGLRRDMLTEKLTPNLARHATAAERFEAHRSMFPSATRVVSASFSTGCIPAHHELQGNSLALLESGRLVHHDAGHPGFLQHKRKVTGRSLGRPTIAERVKERGGAVIYANVSPGAAYAHDPDGHGTVFHRAGSFGPGRKPVEGWNAKDVPQGIDGDRMLARRFIDQAVLGSQPAFALLWCAEPDLTSHAVPLGSPRHLAMLAAADAIAADVIAAVGSARAKGDDIVLLVGSDHGHQTVKALIDIEAELIAAGLKDGRRQRRHDIRLERHLGADLRACLGARPHGRARRLSPQAAVGRRRDRCRRVARGRTDHAPRPRLRRRDRRDRGVERARDCGPQL